MTDLLAPYWSDFAIGLLVFALPVILTLALNTGYRDQSALARFKTAIGADAVPSAVVALFGLFWVAIFLALFGAILTVILHGTSRLLAGAETMDLRGDAILLAAFTATLGAVVALPLTLIRIGLTRQQNDHAAQVLFNDKISAAAADLYATKETTRRFQPMGERPAWRDMREDDIVRRIAAIDALEGLADERSDEVPRIARMLGVYVRELSREYPAETLPPGLVGEAIEDWARSLKVKRTDAQAAVQALGRLRKRHNDRFTTQRIDLRAANLQAMDLSGSAFSFEGALFQEAQLQGATLINAQMRSAYLNNAAMQGAMLFTANLKDASLKKAKLQGAHLVKSQMNFRTVLAKAEMEGAYLQMAEMQGVNLQEALMQCTHIRLANLQGALLKGTQMNGANLRQVQMDRSTDVTATIFQGAAFRSADLTDVPRIADHLGDVFGDLSVRLPQGTKAPGHWLDYVADRESFEFAWRKWQAEIGFDPEDPATWDAPKPKGR
jgi:uncharacterized protein YjbI with pentapeptide repeats